MGKGESKVSLWVPLPEQAKQKQEREDNEATVNSCATVVPLSMASPRKEAESGPDSGSSTSPPMEGGAYVSAEEEDGIAIKKEKGEEAKVLEPSDLEEEGSLARSEGAGNSWLPTPSLVNNRVGVVSLVAPQQGDSSLKDC